ncbi:MAG: AAA family ATPase [Patescibacteria group bacterium]
MRLKTLELNGFKSFAGKTVLEFENPIVCIVGPNGSGKSNVVEAFRYVLGEQSMKSMRGKSGSDLIFKGSKNLSKASRASVSIYFDNSDKVFELENDGGENINLNYDTVSISREVFSDGLNKYILNGTDVRLKDIHALLASVNIGSSGHHIISQGEADRILNANPKDRKEMVEDALGLKIFQYKIKDSTRKLEKTEENMKEVTMLRRENAPHLNFLKKQVEKFEKAKEMQAELATLYREYLKKESIYLESEKKNLSKEKHKISEELKIVSAKISAVEDADPLRHSDTSPESRGRKSGSSSVEELRIVEQKLNGIRGEKGEIERKLGRIEGMIEAKQNRVKISGRCPTCGRELGEVSKEQIENRENSEKELQELKNSQASILTQVADFQNQEKEFSSQIEALKQAINTEMEALRDLEREKFSHKVRHQELSSALEMIRIKETNLKSREEAFYNEIKEGVALIGQEILAYKNHQLEKENERNSPEEQKKKIERLKIKLEDAGMGSGAEVMKEFKETSARDEFLARELEDLTKSIEALQKLIADLKEKIDIEFKEGVKKINKEFEAFFMLLFGGGTGSLSVITENKKKRNTEMDEEMRKEMNIEDDDIVFEQGIEINVSLPHKKVKELHALSGGERSLTSIALLFAMSQVNPPPFLVLDETDAALDEANSRKYGDMLEKLSKRSQLVVVTHNRETMSRAGVLYGVTIGSNGASKLLSVKFDEATAIAK